MVDFFPKLGYNTYEFRKTMPDKPRKEIKIYGKRERFSCI